jgi:hypothetical protein
MPITEELKNVKKFESVGFSHEQAEALAETLEQAQINGQESLKDFISNEIGKLRVEFGNEFRNIHGQLKDVQSQFKDVLKEINASELRMKASQTDLLVKIFGIVVGTVGMAVTILKLFP